MSEDITQKNTHTRDQAYPYKKNITSLPIYFKYYIGYDDVRYTRYYYRYSNNKLSHTDLEYQREHLSFKFYKPVDLYIGTFTPSIELYHTQWHDFSDGAVMPTENRVSGFAKLKVNGDTISRDTYMQYHTFKLNEIYKNYKSFKHSIFNTLTYKQIPNVNQKRLVDHISYDNIDWTKEYAYTLSNYFDGKDWSANLKKFTRLFSASGN